MKIDTDTRIYGVLGYPVRHSRSPAIFNAAFEKMGMNAVYLFCEQKDGGRAVEAARAMNIAGLSVTIPHKLTVIPHLDELDEGARILGSVNTIINRDGRLTGYNYDGEGAILPLIDAASSLTDKKILILGNGGAARGIAMCLVWKHGVKRLSLLVRNEKKAAPLAADLGELGAEIDIILGYDSDISGHDIIINTTSVGMHPNVDESPLDPGQLDSSMLVYDIVYNPLETRLLQDALAKGCPVIYGDQMFIGQASLQFKLWTEKQAPVETMRESLNLSYNNGES